MSSNQKYDVVIIGSGLGGLMSAIILAKEGKRVCVLEKNNQYGGNLQCFVRDKILFDTGVHYLGSLSENQILNKCFKYAGIMDKLDLQPLNPDGFDYICFGDDPIEYPYAQGYTNFIKQLTSFFPSEQKAIEYYCRTLQDICDKFPLYRLKSEKYYDNLDIFSIKLEAYIKKLTSNTHLQAVLTGTSFLYGGVSSQTPLYVHALSVNSYIESAWRCKKGGAQITNLLIKELRKHGVDLFKHNQVTHFLYDEKNIKAVQTTQGKTFYGTLFISNIDIKTTLLLAGKERFKKAYYNRIMRLKPISAAFSLHITLKPNTFPYYLSNFYYFDKKEHVWNAAQCLHFTSYLLTMNPSKEHSNWSESISILTYMSFEQVKQWESTFNTKTCEQSRGNDYEKFKQQKVEELICLVEKKFPNIRQCINKIYTSSPLSYRDYIGTSHGSMYGYTKEADFPMNNFILPNTHIPNLFLTGQTVNMHGLFGVTIGAIRTCSHILGKGNFLIEKIRKS
ncbi:phytoene desaturase family protein [Capnocytophaga catalasegens]|uniref:All-trans-retinol 13,14-reductase n=1 Tax=Capnocytophaga catalasegens TaxID=1004260 RepID=A0AAV5B188_9FLAO|nr:NAD(P)/FAD-dependent oxidoreductase [Capnocytophaga catalasegens]GIZ14382.1 all-trans-retinol 13,14-reductase [Capnocytophaga catalasegens]GJM51502.1 all-trans-retinol 13,14-reductase [Capnocytophaga catalasegens]GJM53406.1 all-trans-retinol 13,14-reductase [Capnocytophaga catalasegens]